MRKILALRFLPSMSRVRSLALVGSLYSMRAMVSLKLPGFCRVREHRGITGSCLPALNGSTSPLHNRHPGCTNRLRRSQIAAVLAFDFGTSNFAEWGLVRAKIRRGMFRVKHQ